MSRTPSEMPEGRPAELAEVPALVETAHREGRFRPVAMAVVEDAQGKILMLQSAKNPDYWGVPQGGIERGEVPTEATLREVEEEAGLPVESLSVVGFSGYEDLAAEASRTDKRGFSEGKRYFFFRVRCDGVEPELTVDPEEIADGFWMSPDRFEEQTESVRLAKRDLLRRAVFG